MQKPAVKDRLYEAAGAGTAPSAQKTALSATTWTRNGLFVNHLNCEANGV